VPLWHPAAFVAREDDTRRLQRIRALAARADSHPALLAAARKLRTHLPGDQRFGDPLSIAGQHPAEVLGRGVSQLQPPGRASVAQELGMSALQVWQSMSEASGRGRGSDSITLLFTDLVGFSTWALQAGDEAAVDLLRTVNDNVERALIAHGGRIVKRMGDGVMATTLHPDDAVDGALAAGEALQDVEVAGFRPQLRVGIHCGRPRRIGGDYLGVDVNITARVMSRARPGEVLVTVRACEQLDGERFTTGDPRHVSAPGTPEDLRVRPVQRR
jgi:adenylate cyclase